MQTKDIKSSPAILSTDVSALQAMVLKLNQKVVEIAQNYEVENKLLRERVHQLEHQLYGRKSEKLSTPDGFEQSSLFDSNEVTSPPPECQQREEITVPSHKRKKRGRKGLSVELPRVEVYHEIVDSLKQCGCGSKMSRIGEEVSEQLEMIPARFWVVRHIRPKYACRNCEGVKGNEGELTVKIAPTPPQLLPKTISTPSLLSHILVSKFCDSLPYYRQEKQFKRLGLELSRATMCNWTVKVAERCRALTELLRREILSGPLINIDETTFQVLKEPERRVNSDSYMWVMRGGSPEKVGVFYHYAENRSSVVASSILKGYRGYVQTDGYGAYNFLDHRDGIIHVGCWAHARRKFVDVLRATGVKNINKVRHKLKSLGKGGEALDFICTLYDIERKMKAVGLTPEEVYEQRQEKAKPILDEFEKWLKETAPGAPAKHPLGKALNYTLGQWHRLIRYLDDGIIPMDNNWAENAIRPFVVGRKNWLFFEQPGGAEAGAMMYSLIESAKSNGLEPYRYLCYIFDKLPGIGDDKNKLTALLPMELNADTLEIHHEQYKERWMR